MNDRNRMRDVSTTEMLLVLLDKSEGWLNRMTRYAGWTFFFLFMFVLLLSVIIAWGIQVLGATTTVVTMVGVVLEILVWAVLVVYWFVYYRIKAENDAWKIRITELKQREEAFMTER